MGFPFERPRWACPLATARAPLADRASPHLPKEPPSSESRAAALQRSSRTLCPVRPARGGYPASARLPTSPEETQRDPPSSPPRTCQVLFRAATCLHVGRDAASGAGSESALGAAPGLALPAWCSSAGCAAAKTAALPECAPGLLCADRTLSGCGGDMKRSGIAGGGSGLGKVSDRWMNNVQDIIEWGHVKTYMRRWVSFRASPAWFPFCVCVCVLFRCRRWSGLKVVSICRTKELA